MKTLLRKNIIIGLSIGAFALSANASSAYASWKPMTAPFPNGMVNCANIEGNKTSEALLCLAVRCGPLGSFDMLQLQGGDYSPFVKLGIDGWTRTFQLAPEHSVWNAAGWPAAFVSINRDDELWARLRTARRVTFSTTATKSTGVTISQTGFAQQFTRLDQTCNATPKR